MENIADVKAGHKVKLLREAFDLVSRMICSQREFLFRLTTGCSLPFINELG